MNRKKITKRVLILEKLYDEKKIFVTVGTHEQQFERLINQVNDIAKDNKNYIFNVQYGYNKKAMNNNIKNVKMNKFLEEKEFLQAVKESDIIISHGGPGSMFLPWKYNKPIIAVPRLKKFSEHVDDHQVDFCEKMHSIGKVKLVIDIEDLPMLLNETINEQGQKKIEKYRNNNDNFIIEFEKKIKELFGD